MMSISKLLLLMVAAVLTLTACGIRPGQLAAPQGDDKDQFPHTYPSRETLK